MHFIPEACYRRPLEPKSLVYSRGGTAITMGVAFLAFCGYLASQIYYDRFLILFSSEPIYGSTNTADVEFCVQNSTMTLVQCNVMYVNWSSYVIPDCSTRLFRKGADGATTHCYVFETNGSYTMGVTSDSNVDAVKRFDFYWKIDSLVNISAASLSVPAIALQLYDPTFSPWKAATIGNTPAETQTLLNIRLGSQRATTYLNATSSIFYTPQRYREIVPGSPRALLGFSPDYIDIVSLEVTQQNWPLSETPPPGALNRNLYHGLVSVQLSQSTINVKTESRQHTLLAAVALAGGCYGVLTTLYILLFGMTRLTPWGLVHHIPVFISNHRHYKKNDKVFEEAMVLESNDKGKKVHGRSDENVVFMEELNDAGNRDPTMKKKKNKSFTKKLIPWFFRSNMKGKVIATDSETSILRRMMTLNDGNRTNDHESVIGLERKTSMHVDKDSRTQLPDAAVLSNEPKPSMEELNELSTTSDFLLNTPIHKHQQRFSSSAASIRNQAVGSPSSLFFNEHEINNAFSPTITKRPSVASDILLIETSQSQQQQQSTQDSVQILTEVIKQEREKSKELATRVDELEVILSQYFINTAYLDQLRTRREQSFMGGMNTDVKRRSGKPSNEEL